MICFVAISIGFIALSYFYWLFCAYNGIKVAECSQVTINVVTYNRAANDFWLYRLHRELFFFYFFILKCKNRFKRLTRSPAQTFKWFQKSLPDASEKEAFKEDLYQMCMNGCVHQCVYTKALMQWLGWKPLQSVSLRCYLFAYSLCVLIHSANGSCL